MKSFKFLIHGTEFNVDVIGIESNVASIEVNGTKYDVQIEQELKQSKTPKLLRPVVSGIPKPVIDKKEKGAPVQLKHPCQGIYFLLQLSPVILLKGTIAFDYGSYENGKSGTCRKDGVVESIKVEPGQGVLQGDILLELI